MRERKNPLHPGLWLRLFPKSVLKMTMSSSNTTCFNSGEGTCPSKQPREILSYTLLCRCPSRDQARSCLLRIISNFLLWLIIILCCSRLVINYFIFNLHPEIGQHRPCDPCQAMPWGQRLKKNKVVSLYILETICKSWRHFKNENSLMWRIIPPF